MPETLPYQFLLVLHTVREQIVGDVILRPIGFVHHLDGETLHAFGERLKLGAMRFVAFGALGEERSQSKRHFDRLRGHHDQEGIGEKCHFVVLKIFQLRINQRRTGLEKTSGALGRFALERKKQTRFVFLVLRIDGRFFRYEKIQTLHVVALVGSRCKVNWKIAVVVRLSNADAELDGSFHDVEMLRPCDVM